MKHEWRKKEKEFYLPKTTAEIVDIPEFSFITLSGEGNPNSALFSDCISALYSVAYAIKMNLKKMENTPKDYQDWTAYPLEGVWDINDEAKKNFSGKINKDDLVFDIMIRQPDFKSMLTGTTELRAYIETWEADGWELSVDFKYTLGEPDYQYYTVNRLLNYDTNSLEGVPYGVSHGKDLTRTVTIPNEAEATSLRTIITGWGHTTPTDPDGRPCAEWCFRTHKIKIDGNDMFSHNMGGLGCNMNPTSNQAGNWQPDRAG